MTDFLNDSIKIGTVFGSLVVVKILDNKRYECKCLCNNLEVFNGESLLKGEIKKCSKCQESIKMKLDNRNRKELYYIWNKFKELYKKPTPKFKREIINKGIKFFPTIVDLEDGFEFFYQWSIKDYGRHSGQCNLARISWEKDFNEDNCLWTSAKTDNFFRLPKLNEERESQLETTYYGNYDIDDEQECEDSGLYSGDEEDDDFEINLEEVKKDLEEFKKIWEGK